MAAKAPLGQRFDGGNQKFIAVVLAGHVKIKVLGLFTTLVSSLAYVKANYDCQPLGKMRFRTRKGEVLIIQEHVHVLTLGGT